MKIEKGNIYFVFTEFEFKRSEFINLFYKDVFYDSIMRRRVYDKYGEKKVGEILELYNHVDFTELLKFDALSDRYRITLTSLEVCTYSCIMMVDLLHNHENVVTEMKGMGLATREVFFRFIKSLKTQDLLKDSILFVFDFFQNDEIEGTTILNSDEIEGELRAYIGKHIFKSGTTG